MWGRLLPAPFFFCTAVRHDPKLRRISRYYVRARKRPYSVDFRFANFTPGQGTPGADFSDITQMDFIDQSEGGLRAVDWAITSFEAVPIGAPAADVTCYGLGA